MYKFDGCSLCFLFGLEGRAPFPCRDRAPAVDSRVTRGVSADNDAITAVCVAM